MKFTKSWLLIGILVGLLSKNVFSFPAHRTIDLANDLVSDEMDADEQSDDEDVKTDDSKRVEIAKEGSGAEAAKKTAVEEKDSPLTAKAEEKKLDESSGDEKDEKEDVAKAETPKASKKNETEDDHADKEISEKKADLPKPKETEDDDADKEISEKKAALPKTKETEDDDADKEISEKKAAVAKTKSKPKPNVCASKRDGDCCCDCDCDPEHEECCHHHHEHEGCCHNGCCCGHENEHEHCHHENEDCCHHHGHHHGFCHEWGEECCGEHHGHECCGHHEHGHHHEGDHEHCHENCHGCCEHHEEEEPECCDCCCHKRGKVKSAAPKRSDVPVGYHCHDMVSKEGNGKTKRFCIPVYGHTDQARNTIESPSVVKKQTVHVGYGYASGDNYRLGYQEGGMGGLASSFTGQVGADHGGNFDAADHFNKRSDISQPQKRHFEGGGHGYGSFNSGMMHGSATPYGHPVTHPGFTTMGFPGHALASQDVRMMISHPKVRRQAFGQEAQEQGMVPQQMNSMGQMEMGPPPQMEQAQGSYPGMMNQPAESDPMQMQAMQQQEEMQGSMKSMLPRFSNDQAMNNYQQMSSPGQFNNNAQFVGGGYFSNIE